MILMKSSTSVCFIFAFLQVNCVDFDVGNSIDLLAHFGIVSNVLPIGSEDPYEFVETSFSSNVFDKNFVSSQRVTFKVDDAKATWKLHFCLSTESLLNTFFDNYDVELMATRKYKLFASTWKLKDLEVLFGLSSYYFMNEFAFLLIRQEKCLTNVVLKNLPNNETSLNSIFKQTVENINLSQTISINPIFSNFGTHFVKSFSVGDVIFQVLVFPSETTNCFVADERNQVTGMYLDCVLNRIVKHGKIKTLSNTFKVEKMLNEIYNANSTTSTHKHLLDLKLQKKNISDDVCKTNNTAITGFSLSGIYNIIFNATKSLFVKEMVLNQMEIRDVYL